MPLIKAKRWLRTGMLVSAKLIHGNLCACEIICEGETTSIALGLSDDGQFIGQFIGQKIEVVFKGSTVSGWSVA